MRILENEPMSRHTTFRVGGPARFFFIPENEAEAARAVKTCRKDGLSYTIIGKGSNLLVSDGGYDGAIICISEALSDTEISGEIIRAGAGITLAALGALAMRNGLSGLEFAAGIPGSLGGALIMNAGAYGGEMSDVAKSVRLLTQEGELAEVSADWMDFGYRKSRAQEENCVVLGGELALSRGNPEEIGAKMAELAAKRREKQPLEYPSAGSFFKRPEGHYAGALIEQAGLKGLRVGGAQVSEKHAGFIINAKDATAADVAALADEVIRRVWERFGVRLEPEVKRLGSF